MQSRVSRTSRISRRRFVQGLSLAGCCAGGLWQHPARAGPGPDSPSPAGPATLRGDRIALTIAPTPFDATGRLAIATAVNGSVPAPTLRLLEDDSVSIDIINRLAEPTSIHWHGLRLPADQDGVPGLSFAGIAPGERFTYRFPIRQSGTYWYHSHSGMQEQTGLFGALILVPREPEPYHYDRDHVMLLSDWTDEDPMRMLANLKQQSDYYDHQRRTLGTFIEDARRAGFAATLRERLLWGRMRMSPTDILDIGAAAYRYLVNGAPPEANFTALFAAGESVRLRFINAAAMTIFDVRIPGLPMRVIAADGSDVEPVVVDEFRIGAAETYDVIVEPPEAVAYTIFAQAEDRSGYARATLAPRAGMTAAIPAMDPRPLRTLADMGMSGTDMSGMSPMSMDMPGMEHGATPGPTPGPAGTANADGIDARTLAGQPAVDNVAMHPRPRMDEAGDGLGSNGRRALRYGDLRALEPDTDERPVERELEFHLTGNMQRWVWGFDGRKFSEVGPIHVRLGERVRFVLVNDTMMEHPIHLHGFLVSLENGQQGRLPLKHTITVKPGERLSFVYTADTPGHWAFHCHLMLHMDTGMFRTVIVA